jgi:hypothetical protein
MQQEHEQFTLRCAASRFAAMRGVAFRVPFILDETGSGAAMKRKYGSALSRESEAEKAQRLRAKEMRDNRHNYGSASRKGAATRGKKRGRAYRVGS